MNNHGKDYLSVLCDSLHLFYGNRDETVPTASGMGEAQEPFSGGNVILRILFWPLARLRPCCHLWIQPLYSLVAAGLLLNCSGNCLAKCLSMDSIVLVDGQNR